MKHHPQSLARLALPVLLAAFVAAACTPGGSGATTAPGASVAPAAASSAPSAAPAAVPSVAPSGGKGGYGY